MLDMSRDDATETMIRNLRRMMAAAGLNPHTLADRAGINPTGVYDILNGKARSPKLETVAKLAHALGTSVSGLIEDASEATLRSDLQAIALQLDHEEQERLLAIARALLDAQEKR